jgi:hypothetical protein
MGESHAYSPHRASYVCACLSHREGESASITLEVAQQLDWTSLRGAVIETLSVLLQGFSRTEAWLKVSFLTALRILQSRVCDNPRTVMYAALSWATAQEHVTYEQLQMLFLCVPWDKVPWAQIEVAIGAMCTSPRLDARLVMGCICNCASGSAQNDHYSSRPLDSLRLLSRTHTVADTIGSHRVYSEDSAASLQLWMSSGERVDFQLGPLYNLLHISQAQVASPSYIQHDSYPISSIPCGRPRAWVMAPLGADDGLECAYVERDVHNHAVHVKSATNDETLFSHLLPPFVMGEVVCSSCTVSYLSVVTADGYLLRWGRNTSCDGNHTGNKDAFAVAVARVPEHTHVRCMHEYRANPLSTSACGRNITILGSEEGEMVVLESSSHNFSHVVTLPAATGTDSIVCTEYWAEREVIVCAHKNGTLSFWAVTNVPGCGAELKLYVRHVKTLELNAPPLFDAGCVTDAHSSPVECVQLESRITQLRDQPCPCAQRLICIGNTLVVFASDGCAYVFA